MKLTLFACLALTFLALTAPARFLPNWPEDKLQSGSDLIAVGTSVSTRDLAETNSLGWPGSATFQPKFRGVETTFKISDARKGMPENDQIILHHYREEPAWGSPPNGPMLINLAYYGTNQLMLYLVKDGSNRYAPVTGQVDASLSVQPLPTNYWLLAGFPSPPPVADADPAIGHPVTIHVPLGLRAERQKKFINIETTGMVLTNLLVGTNMVTGTETGFYHHDKLLNVALQGRLPADVYQDSLPLSFAEFLKPDGTFEIKLTVFETDEPVQHMWSPQSGKKYQVLWEHTFKVVLK